MSSKIGYDSPHTATLDLVPAGAKVLDLGCAGGYMSALLERERGCQTTGVDRFPLAPNTKLNRFIEHDLNAGIPDVNIAEYDYVLLLDVIEHLNVPEVFFDRLRDAMKHCTNTKLIISTPNVGFLIIRLMLLLGQFNYGKRGILDMTHTRLFTFSSLRQLLEQRGFQISKSRGIPCAVSRRVGKQPAKPLPGRCKQIVSAAVSFIVFLPNARGGCTGTFVRAAFAARDRRIFRARKHTSIDVDMTRFAAGSARGWI